MGGVLGFRAACVYGLLSMLSFRSLRSRVQGVGETDGERVRERERKKKRDCECAWSCACACVLVCVI